MKLACWNVNSIRARKDRVLSWLDQHLPDVLCMGETKVVDAEFPKDDFESRGYHLAISGEKTYNGVAIISRAPIENVRFGLEDEVDDRQRRLVSAEISGLRVISLYVPNGGELGSPKFTYKLEWLKRLRAYLERTANPDQPIVLGGDFNIVLRDCDAANPDAWRETVLMHPDARTALESVLAWGLEDVFAVRNPRGSVYSWWDYRQLAFPKNNGLRLDYWLVSKGLLEHCDAITIDREARKGEKPSDHAPVVMELHWP